MRDDIKAVFIGSTLTAGGAVTRLESALMPGERVLAAATCNHSGGPGIIAVTDRRVSLVSNVPTRESSVDFVLGQISTVSPTGGLMSGGLTITAAGRTEKVKAIKTKTAERIAAAVRQAIEQAQQTPTGSASGSSAADELAKYGQMLKDGLLTQDEFDRKKAELL